MKPNRRALGCVAMLIAAITLTGCGNRGADTSCADFLGMSRTEREAVVKKSVLFHPPISTAASQADAATSVCKGQPGATTVGEALGP